MSKLALLLACLLFTTIARAQPAPDATLYLRVETGVHEADINHIALLPDGSIVSVSDDKTARIWSPDRLDPRGVIHSPIGEADDGALYAVAANQKLLAVAGRVHDANRSFAVDFFALPQLRPVGLLPRQSQPITALRFSPNGQLLAIGFLQGGISLGNLKTGSAQPIAPDYRGNVTTLAFAPDGRLFVAGEIDGIRIYNPDGYLLIHQPPRSGVQPFGISISPDGSILAVTNRNRATVALLDSFTLKPQRELRGLPGRLGGLDVVAFAPDSNFLYAAGTYKDLNGRRFILRWPLDHAATPSEFAVANDSITDLLPVVGGLFFSSAEPSVGRLDEAGHLAALRHSHHIDFRNASLTSFRISFDGSKIELPTAPPSVELSGKIAGAPSIVFDVLARQISSPADVPDKLAPFYGAARRLAVTEWQNAHTPRINGRLIELEPEEHARSIDVAQAGDVAAIGTDFYLRLETADHEVKRIPVPSPVWAVNISGDGRLVVAGLGDGTIHWYRLRDGEELLSAFIDPITRQFVVWTKDGFFDHDHRDDGLADGRDLIGYAVSDVSGRISDFVGLGQLYSQFFRPDLVGLAFEDTIPGQQMIANSRDLLGSVSQILQRGLPARAVIVDACGQADAGGNPSCPAARSLDTAHPPAHPEAAMETTAGTLLMQFRLDNPSGAPGSAVLSRNEAVFASPVSTTQQNAHSATEQAAVPLSLGMNIIRVTPVSSSGAVEANSSQIAQIAVYRAPAERSVPAPSAGQKPATQPPAPPATTLYLLSIGISSYDQHEISLPNPARDAQAVFKLMGAVDAPVYENVVSKLLVDQNATSANILAALQDIATNAGPDDMVLIFFAGHGESIDGKYYFAPAEFGMADSAEFQKAFSPEEDQQEAERLYNDLFRHDGLEQKKLLSVIRTIRAAHVAILIDTCFSGRIATEDAVLRRDINTATSSSIGHETGRFVMSSSFAQAQDSAGLQGPAAEHGMFTYFLLKALGGEADTDHSGRIDVYKLANYTKREVTAATAASGQPQHPEFFFAGNDFFDLRALQTAK